MASGMLDLGGQRLAETEDTERRPQSSQVDTMDQEGTWPAAECWLLKGQGLCPLDGHRSVGGSRNDK